MIIKIEEKTYDVQYSYYPSEPDVGYEENIDIEDIWDMDINEEIPYEKVTGKFLEEIEEKVWDEIKDIRGY